MPRVTIQIQHNVELVVASQPIVKGLQVVAPKRTTSTAFRQTNASVKQMSAVLHSSTVMIVASCLFVIMSQSRLRAKCAFQTTHAVNSPVVTAAKTMVYSAVQLTTVAVAANVWHWSMVVAMTPPVRIATMI